VNGQPLSYSDVARICGTGLISTGVGLLLFVVITVVWGDPFTRISEGRAQDKLAREYVNLVGDAPLTTSRLDPRLTRGSARTHKRALKNGDVAARMRIPQIDLRKYVVKGATQPALTKGPGFYEETGFPGSGLPVAIAGHRTTHGAPFLNIDKLKPGNTIVLDVPYGRFTYTVTKSRIISPRDWSSFAWAQHSAPRHGRAARRVRVSTWC
jgi:sortase A